VGLEVVAERVEIGDQVAQVAVGEDEAGDLRLVGGAFGCNVTGGAVGEVEAGEEQRFSGGC